MKTWQLLGATSFLILGSAWACTHDHEAEAPDGEMVPASGSAVVRRPPPPGAGSSAPEKDVKAAKPKAVPPRGQNPWGANGYGAPLPP